VFVLRQISSRAPPCFIDTRYSFADLLFRRERSNGDDLPDDKSENVVLLPTVAALDEVDRLAEEAFPRVAT
jgi:hypothetical protein